MTKKDYELIARIFNKNISSTTENENMVKYTAVQINAAVAHQFADVLARHNARFDKAKFLTACGI